MCACSYRVTPRHCQHPQREMSEVLQLFDVYSFNCVSRVALGLIPLPGVEVMKGEVAQGDCPVAHITQPLGEFQRGEVLWLRAWQISLRPGVAQISSSHQFSLRKIAFLGDLDQRLECVSCLNGPVPA